MVQSTMQYSGTVQSCKTTAGHTVQDRTAMGHLYLTVTIDGQLAQCSLFTVSDILKSKLLCALWITIVDISCHTWCGCIVLCVFSSFILSFSFYLMVLFLLNGQLLVWKLAKPEKLSQFCFFKKEIHRGEEKALGR